MNIENSGVEALDKAIASIIEKIQITDDDLKLVNIEDFAQAFKERLIRQMDQENCLQLLIKPLAELMINKTATKLSPLQVEQIEHEIAEIFSKKLLNHLGDLTLPAPILKAWEEAKNQSAKITPDTRAKCRTTLFKNRSVEPRPNHAAVSDLLNIIPYPHKWKDYGIELGDAIIPHSSERYVQYQLFGMDSTGDFIPISQETKQDIIGSFDWVDHKILCLLLMRTLESGGDKFVLSLNWLADLITDDRHMQSSDNLGKRKYLRRADRLKDIEKRIRRLRMLFLQVKWHEGEGKNQKLYNLLRQEGIKEIEFALFIVHMIWTERKGNKQDILAEIEPGRWYQLFCKGLRQFTWIPRNLLSIDTYRNWRRYAIGDYVVREYRANLDYLKEVNNLKSDPPLKVLHRKLETLIKEVITPEEIEYALINRDKGWRLKKAILEDFEHFQEVGWYVHYQFPDGGFDAFLSGFIDIAPDLDTSKAIYNTLNSRQSLAKPAPPKEPRKSATISGEKIKKARLAKGWTQRDMVKALDAYLEVSQRKISFWESGKTLPTVKEARTLKKVLDI